ncbi:TonB-dependent receptor [Sphingobium sp. Cam5-1]|nr:TonB-dependent receptor [Sphingobium sp. Cam5-1]
MYRSKVAVFAFALLLIADAGFHPAPADAKELLYRLDIPSEPLSVSLSRISAIAGVSIGLPGDMPHVFSGPVKGTMSVETALGRLLKGSGYRAVRLGPALYRIERQAVATPPPVRSLAPALPSPDVPAPDIVVTAQKRLQPLATLPLSVSVLSLDSLAAGSGSPTSRDISLNMEGLSMTNLGPGRNRQFIRNVADSPFNGQSQSTVAVQVDDARVTFDAPDPDLRLIDIERVEILKGPQGPLYGSGALGGIYHIVTRQPELDRIGGAIRLSGQSVAHGGTGTGGEAIVNMPIVKGTLAVRAVGYRFVDAGWIDSGAGRKDSNAVKTSGWRLGVRWRPTNLWTVDVGVAMQDLDARDSQYVVADRKTLSRSTLFAEPSYNDFKLFHASVEGELGSVKLRSATSYVDHRFNYVIDATGAAAQFAILEAARFTERRAYTLFNQELRLTPSNGGPWLIGLSYLRATTGVHSTIAAVSQPLSPTAVQSLDRTVTEFALFGENKFSVLPGLDATVGARLFHSTAEDETTEMARTRSQSIAKTILSPSLTLSRPFAERGVLYLRYARAMRPGGLASVGQSNGGRFNADELDTVDLGFRQSSGNGRLSLSASSYFTRWSDIQSDFLLPNGLISTRNAGRGDIIGIEGTIDWSLGRGFGVSAGGSFQSARLTHAADGLKLDDTRLPVTPDLTGRLAINQHVTLGGWQGQAVLQANYIGSARLTFDSDLDREMGRYATLSTYADLSRSFWTIGLRVDNIFDVKGDSFAFGNPFSIRKAPQFTPLRPRMITASIARRL